MPLLAVAEEPARLAACVAIAGDWLAVGLDPRPDRLREYPWRGRRPPTLGDLVARLTDAGVHRFVLSHGGSTPDLALIEQASAGGAAEVLVAGGVQDLAEVARLRSAGVRGLILGEVLLAGPARLPGGPCRCRLTIAALRAGWPVRLPGGRRR